jgi:acyl-CoA thioesterase
MDNERIKRFFKEKDAFSNLLGIRLTEVGEGFARAELDVEARHMNPFGIAHAGAVFTLADAAFGAAVNSLGRLSLAVNINASFVKAGRPGRLVAEARPLSLGKKLSSFALEVRDESGDAIATFQGMAYHKREALFEDGQGG